MPRRRGLLAVACVLVLTLASGCVGDDGPRLATFELGVHLEELPAGAAPVHHRGVDAWLVQQPDGTIDAFWARSPHRGCYVMLYAEGSREYASLRGFHLDDRPGVFRDVCAGSTFLLSGERVFGPSWRGLDRFAVTGVERATEGDRVTVDFSKVVLGTCGDAGVDAGLPCSPPREPVEVDGPSLLDWP